MLTVSKYEVVPRMHYKQFTLSPINLKSYLNMEEITIT